MLQLKEIFKISDIFYLMSVFISKMSKNWLTLTMPCVTIVLLPVLHGIDTLLLQLLLQLVHTFLGH